jgi:RND family efflux transporter MFP subunit
MVSILCVQFECERVAFAEYHHHHCHVLALSNSAEFDRRSNLILLIGDAMDESIEQDSLIVFPQSTSKLIQRAHQELARKYGSSSLCTIPLIDNSHFFGAITLLSSEVNAMDKKSVMLCQQFLSLATPFLVQKREQEKSIFTKCAYALTENVKGLIGFTFLKFKLISGLVVLLLVFASLVEYEHQVSADAVLEGKIQRVIAAPISGYLLSASVRAGDSVKQGDEMATLNDNDLRLEQAKLEGHLQKLQRQYRKAQSNRDLVNVRVVKEQINQAKAELALNTELLAKTHLLAPFDGVVIEGNLEQMLGTPIERGDGLFKIAPLAGYRIILKVNESDIAHIQKGQQGGLLLSSLPNSHLQLTVENITAVSKADNGENIFRVEASLLNTPDILRPGMQGLGKINTGRASLLWIWTHKIKDAISLWLWSWLP